MDKQKIQDLLQVFLTLQVTKELPRQGFINFGFKRNESDSVAAHSFTVCALSFLLARYLEQQGYDCSADRALRIALVHDMGEAISGDIGYHVKRFAGELLDKVEEQTFGMLVEKLDIQAELTDLYHEYKELESPESKIVKCADALDAYTQMLLTPGANLRSQQSFVDEKSKELSGDLVLGNFVSDFFNQAILLLKKREVHFIGE